MSALGQSRDGGARYKGYVVGAGDPYVVNRKGAYFPEAFAVNEEGYAFRRNADEYPIASQILMGQGREPLKPGEIYFQQFSGHRDTKNPVVNAKIEDLEDPADTLMHEFMHRAVDAPWYDEFADWAESESSGNLATRSSRNIARTIRSLASSERIEQSFAHTLSDIARGEADTDLYSKDVANQKNLLKIDEALRAFFTPERQEKYGIRLPIKATEPEYPSILNRIMDATNSTKDYVMDTLLGAEEEDSDFYGSALPMQHGGPVKFNEGGITSLGSRQEMVPVDPSFRDRIEMFLSDTFGHTPVGRRRANMFMSAAEWMPGVDEGLLFSDAGEAAEQGNYITSGVLGGLGALSVFPFVPSGAGRSLKEIMESLKKKMEVRTEREARGEYEFVPPPPGEIRSYPTGSWGARKKDFRPDAAALKASAARQGYETDRVLYRANKKDSPMFNFSRGEGRAGPYLVSDPHIAGKYIDMADEAPNMTPVYVKGPGLKLTRAGKQGSPFGPEFRQEAAQKLDISLENMRRSDQVDAIMDAAREQGYGYVEMEGIMDIGGLQSQVIPLGGNKVRSIWAQFDPGLADDATSLSHASGGLVTLPQQFNRGGSVRGFQEGGTLPTELKVTGTRGLTPGTNYSTAYDVGAWDVDEYLATQASMAAEAGLAESVEFTRREQILAKKEALRKELAKMGRQGKINLLNDDQIIDLYNKMKAGVPITATLVDSYKITPVETGTESAWLTEQIEALDKIESTLEGEGVDVSTDISVADQIVALNQDRAFWDAVTGATSPLTGAVNTFAPAAPAIPAAPAVPAVPAAPAAPPTLAELVGQYGVDRTIDPSTYTDDDELLELYGYVLDEFNQAKRTPAGTQYRTEAEDYFEQVKAAISSRGLEIPTGTFTQNVSAAGSIVGGWMDKIFDFFGYTQT